MAAAKNRAAIPIETPMMKLCNSISATCHCGCKGRTNADELAGPRPATNSLRRAVKGRSIRSEPCATGCTLGACCREAAGLPGPTFSIQRPPRSSPSPRGRQFSAVQRRQGTLRSVLRGEPNLVLVRRRPTGQGNLVLGACHSRNQSLRVSWLEGPSQPLAAPRRVRKRWPQPPIRSCWPRSGRRRGGTC
jgi:hypothetical protein